MRSSPRWAHASRPSCSTHWSTASGASSSNCRPNPCRADTGYSPGSVLRLLLDRHGLLGYFEYAYFSNEHGMSKPDTRVFVHVLEELDVRPAEAAHVGDIQRTDVAGAQAAGMSAVHFVGVNNRDVPHSTGDVIVSHFEELPQALGGLTCAGC